MVKMFFILLSVLAGFLVGGLVGASTVPAGAGLDAGATVFLWATGGLVLFLLVSLRCSKQFSTPALRAGLAILFAVNGILLFVLSGNVRNAHAEAAVPRYPHLAKSGLPQGLGVLVISPLPGSNMLFYAQPATGMQPDDYPSSGQVLFGQALPTVDIVEAPPWLVPEHLKMDYEIFHLRVITLTSGWAEVIGNSSTGETWWVDRTQGRFLAWPEFFLGVPVVIPFEGIRIHARPLDDSPVLATTSEPLEPLAVRGDWLKVSISRLADRMPPEGWLRWRTGDRLMIGYEPLR